MRLVADMLSLLEHVIDNEGIHADPEKIQGIQDWHTPNGRMNYKPSLVF